MNRSTVRPHLCLPYAGTRIHRITRCPGLRGWSRASSGDLPTSSDLRHFDRLAFSTLRLRDSDMGTYGRNQRL
jgi:hypothetical protein